MKQPVERHHQIFVNYGKIGLKAFKLLPLFFETFSLDLSGKLFLITSKLSQLDYPTIFSKRNVNKII